jgi:uncharacterized protein (DUF2249 family)
MSRATDTTLPDATPADRPRERMDVADLPPPEPMVETMEALADLDPDAVLVQVNDRAPRHLYPKLEDRGYDHATVETDECVVTTIWRR